MKKIVISMMLVSSLLIVGCSTHIHTVGYGPQSGVTKTARQYYLLWGLVPINTVDTQASLSKGEIDYEIRTKIAATDFIITYGSSVALVMMGVPLVGFITSRTVIVTK